MKKITILFCLLVTSLGFAQVTLEDFEGTAPDLAFSNGPGTAAIVADPAAGGTNGNVLEIITGAASAPWQQAELTLQGDFMDLSGATKEVSVDVYSTTAFDMLAKVTGGVNPTSGAGVADSATDASHSGTGWETLTFDFTNPKDGLGAATGVYENIYFFNLWDSAASGGVGGWVCGTADCSPVFTSYVDNVSALAAAPPATCTDGIENGDETGVDCGGTNCAPCAVPPTSAAPTPPNRPAADVISFFSDAYTDITVDTFDTPWCPNTTTDVVVDGNATKLMTGAVCEGVDWQSSRTVDASSFTHFHIDIYTDEVDMVGKVFNSKFSQWGGGAGEVSALTLDLNTGTVPAIVSGSWLSIDVEIATAFGGDLTRDDIVQFIITTNLNNVWYDNLYLHKNTVLSTDEFETADFKVFPNPTKDNWNITSNTVINSVAVYDILGKQVSSLSPNSNDVEISTANIRSGIYFAKIESDNGSKTVKLIKE